MIIFENNGCVYCYTTTNSKRFDEMPGTKADPSLGKADACETIYYLFKFHKDPESGRVILENYI